jgi:anti-anti-sigma factor
MSSALASTHPNPDGALQPGMFACSSLDATCVHVAGELDIATAPQLGLALRDAQAHAHLVVLDLCELAFIDAAGLHRVIDAAGNARAAGRRLVVLPAPAAVERLFTLTGTHACLERCAAAPQSAPPHAHEALGASRSSVRAP